MEERNLSEDEQDFIERFQRQNRLPSEEDRKQEKVVRRRRRSGIAFNSLLVLLTVAPFALSAVFLYALGRFQNLFGEGSMDYMRENLTDEEVKQLGSASGVEQLSTAVQLYDNRGTIVGVIFTVFVLLIALALLVRIIARALRSEASE